MCAKDRDRRNKNLFIAILLIQLLGLIFTSIPFALYKNACADPGHQLWWSRGQTQQCPWLMPLLRLVFKLLLHSYRRWRAWNKHYLKWFILKTFLSGVWPLPFSLGLLICIQLDLRANNIRPIIRAANTLVLAVLTMLASLAAMLNEAMLFKMTGKGNKQHGPCCVGHR